MPCILDQIAGVQQTYSMFLLSLVYDLWVLLPRIDTLGISFFRWTSTLSAIAAIGTFTMTVFANNKTMSQTFPSDGTERSFHENDRSDQQELVNARSRCEICSTFRSRRAAHCSRCGTCILDMQHHCAWSGNCIGRKNHKSFVYFLSFSVIWLLQSLLLFGMAVIFVYERISFLVDGAFVLFRLVVLALFVGQLMWQRHLIMRNMTETEEMELSREWARARYLGVEMTKTFDDMRCVHAYDHGNRENILTFLYGCKQQRQELRMWQYILYAMMPLRPSYSNVDRHPVCRENITRRRKLKHAIDAKVDEGLIANGLKPRRALSPDTSGPEVA